MNAIHGSKASVHSFGIRQDEECVMLERFRRMTKPQQERFLIAATGTGADFATMIATLEGKRERAYLQKVREITEEALSCCGI